MIWKKETTTPTSEECKIQDVQDYSSNESIKMTELKYLRRTDFITSVAMSQDEFYKTSLSVTNTGNFGSRPFHQP